MWHFVFLQCSFCLYIFRQIRETVFWLCSESMVVYYIHLFRDSMWPNGHIASQHPPRSDEEKLETQGKAKKQLLDCIPGIHNVCHRVGSII